MSFAKSYTSAFHADVDIVLEFRGGVVYSSQWGIMEISEIDNLEISLYVNRECIQSLTCLCCGNKIISSSNY